MSSSCKQLSPVCPQPPTPGQPARPHGQEPLPTRAVASCSRVESRSRAGSPALHWRPFPSGRRSLYQSTEFAFKAPARPVTEIPRIRGYLVGVERRAGQGARVRHAPATGQWVETTNHFQPATGADPGRHEKRRHGRASDRGKPHRTRFGAIPGPTEGALVDGAKQPMHEKCVKISKRTCADPESARDLPSNSGPGRWFRMSPFRSPRQESDASS
jgi:hypothetical protein